MTFVENQTRQKILHLKKNNKNIYFIFRNKKKGIGSAHKDGIRWCYKKKYTSIVTMDCDGTHNPKYISSLLKKSKYFDMVITSRFKKKKQATGRMKSGNSGKQACKTREIHACCSN